MVGVPGKSKGCSTCRRRKKGCDQKRPICGQCSASGYVCGGYQRDLTFVLHPASKAVEKAVFLPTKPRPSLHSGTASLERSAVITQCQSIFFDVYLPHGRCSVNNQFILKCGRPRNWTNVMRNFTPSDTSLELAFAAFSISRVGRNKDDPRLVKESTKFYGKALKTLQKALYDPSRMHSEQVLTACLLLGLYETFEGAGGKSVGWVSHAQGAARIVELRGPERHADPPAHILFLGTRLPIIYSAILRRKRTFLSNEEWLTVPWRSEHKTGLDRLVDIATYVPSLLEQFDSIRAQMPSASQLHELQSCLSFCRHLQKSLSTWDMIRRPDSEAIPVEHKIMGLGDNYPFAHELIYENHLFLNANLIYWSSALVISNTACEIEFLLASFGFQSTSMLSSTAAAIQISQECANNIAQSIPYCLWPDMGDLGIDYIQFPMCLAFQFFMKSNNSQVCSWMLEKTREMQNKASATGSSMAQTSESYLPVDVDFSMYGAPGLSAQAHTSQEYQTATVSADARNRTTVTPVQAHNYSPSGTGLPLTTDGEPQLPATAINDTDFDADYDMESDYDNQSPYSNSSDLPTSLSSIQGSSSSRSTSQTVVDTSSSIDGDFAFVQENPARYYIDRSESVR